MGQPIIAKVVDNGEETRVFIDGELSTFVNNESPAYHQIMHNRLKNLIRLGYTIYYY